MEKVGDLNRLKQIARQLRKDSLEMVYNAQSGHIGGSFSSAEVLTTLFFNILNHDPKNPKDPKRDRFVLSKGHITPAYYSILSQSGYIPTEELKSYRMLNSRLQGHIDKNKLEYIETSSGSLGQDLSVASGMAIALRLDKNSSKVYCLLGDGELNEGQIWESLMTIKHHNISNLIILIDDNGVQLDGHTKDIKNIEPLEHKFSAFGFYTIIANGHDIEELINAFNEAKRLSDDNNNVVIIAKTIKGKGVSFMENTHEWHGKAPNKEQYDAAMRELND